MELFRTYLYVISCDTRGVNILFDIHFVSSFLPREHLKTGIGTENSSSSGLVMEAVIIISDFSDHANSYMMECRPGTEVCFVRSLHFDFYISLPFDSSISKGTKKAYMGSETLVRDHRFNMLKYNMILGI